MSKSDTMPIKFNAIKTFPNGIEEAPYMQQLPLLQVLVCIVANIL